MNKIVTAQQGGTVVTWDASAPAYIEIKRDRPNEDTQTMGATRSIENAPKEFAEAADALAKALDAVFQLYKDRP